jgi:orotate phosphoribosyltransferase
MAENALTADGIDRLVDVLRDAGVMTFGDLTTKSGRPTPYFIDMGRIRSGAQIARLAECYADGIERVFGDDVDLLFGPAYKGIPLVVATAAALHRRGRDVGFAFDRKEVKDHGEGGKLVGMRPEHGMRVVILEDVTTAGTSVRETVPLLRAQADIVLAGVLVGVDRREQADRPGIAALDGLGEEFSTRVAALATVQDVVARLTGTIVTPEDLVRIEEHWARYGVDGPSSAA